MPFLRKPRTDLVHSANLLKPIEVIGTAEDPCFGRLFDPKDKACMKCGDSEICSIMLGQSNHVKRAKEEAKGNFKDLEKHKAPDLKQVRILARERLIELIKNSPNKGYDFILNEVYTIYFIQGLKKSTIKSMIAKLEEANKITITSNNDLKWKSTKK